MDTITQVRALIPAIQNLPNTPKTARAWHAVAAAEESLCATRRDDDAAIVHLQGALRALQA
ncbi:MAG: hypothetical protein AAF442_00090 [Pseudomonadota bacterium]